MTPPERSAFAARCKEIGNRAFKVEMGMALPCMHVVSVAQGASCRPRSGTTPCWHIRRGSDTWHLVCSCKLQGVTVPHQVSGVCAPRP